MRSLQRGTESRRPRRGVRNPFRSKEFLEEMDLKWEIVREVYHSFYDSEYAKIYEASKKQNRKQSMVDSVTSSNSLEEKNFPKRRESTLRNVQPVLSPVVETKTPSSLSSITQPPSRELTDLGEVVATKDYSDDLKKRTSANHSSSSLAPDRVGLINSEDRQQIEDKPEFGIRHDKETSWIIQTPSLTSVIEDSLDTKDDVGPFQKKKPSPLKRFKKAVRIVIIITKCVMSNRERSKRTERKLLSWTQVHDDLTSHRTAYERYGLTFDPTIFKVTREAQISNEVKATLKNDPSLRTEEQRRIALLYLNTYIEVFGEYPVNMQKALVKVGWYEFFDAKRIVIREGHFSENFYLILSGSAVVTILDKDVKTGEVYSRTVALLKKGNSFGEIGLMRGSKRTGTVTCREDMEVLTVGRQDFIDIFMYIEHDKEPSHIEYLRTIDELDGWPIENLPYDDPRICLFTYFRRGVLLCKDSNTSDWIYIIRTGSCRVLKSLKSTKPNIPFLSLHNSKLNLSKGNLASKSLQIRNSGCQWRHEVPRSPFNAKPVLPNINIGKSQDFLQESRIDGENTVRHINELNSITSGAEDLNSCLPKEESLPITPHDITFVEIQKLGPRDIFGLENVLFGSMRPTTSSSLVSEGTECILISKKFFTSHLSEAVTKIMRRKIRPLPPKSVLQKNLQIKTNWEAYKDFTVTNTLLQRHQLRH
ncbi:hypothetical protein LOTGIDRAFT_228568 [Lottia gigantea]|uniref:Cyclic nucleotide-binding domain-containing protein n=1 Tax=Lottia gigantea TaxID=225164 RepID=V3ZQV0_LOTGI|nr:hypothetical protein LOTGIDRAFT_228568 [Lottia gigantea]ESO93798.1 hypothetical protein LOTGIDRAFT_228568 [Lottia gigantea]